MITTPDSRQLHRQVFVAAPEHGGYWMADYEDIPLPAVRRVVEGSGLVGFEPRFDQTWSSAEQLAWRAAVVAVRHGCRVRVGFCASEGTYAVGVEGGIYPGLTFEAADLLLEGVDLGIGAASYMRRPS